MTAGTTRSAAVQIIVIGAGVIGASIADALARRSADVTVLDMRAPGRGASWASAGLLAPYTEAHGDSVLLQMGARSLEMFDEFVARARNISGRRIEYSRLGTLEVALGEEDLERLAGSKRWLDANGVAATWFDQHAARDFEPALAPEACCGLLIEAHGFVGVQSLVSALLVSARLSGATIETPVEAGTVDVDARRGVATVKAGDRRYTADRVVVATGSWTRRVRVSGVPALPIRPVRGQLLHLRWPDDRMPARPVWSSGCYTVPWSDGSLLVGATVEEAGFDESTTAGGMQTLTSAVQQLLPAASAANMLDARAGLRPACEDGLPVIGSCDAVPGVTFATGHYRNGVLLAPLTAALVASAILDGGRPDAMMAAVTPNRFTRGGDR